MGKPTSREVVAAIAVDAVAAIGALLVAGGVAMIHLPAGLIVLGLLMISATVLLARR